MQRRAEGGGEPHAPESDALTLPLALPLTLPLSLSLVIAALGTQPQPLDCPARRARRVAGYPPSLPASLSPALSRQRWVRALERGGDVGEVALPSTRLVRVRARVRVRVRLTLTLTLTKTYQLPPAWRRVVRRRSASSATTAWQIAGRYEGDMREI